MSSRDHLIKVLESADVAKARLQWTDEERWVYAIMAQRILAKLAWAISRDEPMERRPVEWYGEGAFLVAVIGRGERSTSVVFIAAEPEGGGPSNPGGGGGGGVPCTEIINRATFLLARNGRAWALEQIAGEPMFEPDGNELHNRIMVLHPDISFLDGNDDCVPKPLHPMRGDKIRVANNSRIVEKYAMDHGRADIGAKWPDDHSKMEEMRPISCADPCLPKSHGFPKSLTIDEADFATIFAANGDVPAFADGEIEIYTKNWLQLPSDAESPGDTSVAASWHPSTVPVSRYRQQCGRRIAWESVAKSGKNSRRRIGWPSGLH